MFFLIFTLAFAIFVAEAELDIIVPSFPEIQAIFGLSAFQTELVLSLNLISHCVMAAFAGTIGDKYGKKKAIIIGILVFLTGSFLASLAPNYYLLLAGRILQGGGASFPMVLSFVVALQSVPKAKQLKVMGILSGIGSVAVAIAPTIGSYITFYFGYKGNLIFITILGIFSLLMCMKFLQNDEHVDKKKSISIKEYAVVFKSKIAVLYIFTLGFILAAYYTFIGLAPLYYVNVLGVSLKHFGLYQGLITLVFGALSFLSGSIVKVLGKKLTSAFSVIFWCIFLALMIFGFKYGIKNPVYTTMTMVCFAVASVVPYNILYTLATQCIKGHEGKVSAMITTIRWLLASIAIQIASYFYNHTLSSTIIVILFATFISFITFALLYISDKNIRKQLV